MMNEKQAENWGKYCCLIFSIDCEHRISVGEDGTGCPSHCKARQTPDNYATPESDKGQAPCGSCKHDKNNQASSLKAV